MCPEHEHFAQAPQKQLFPSADGYVRLSVEDLLQIPIEHLMSGLDLENPALIGEGASPTHICGFTEWIGKGEAAITIGWDWQLDFRQTNGICARVGPPRSNLMLLDKHQRDVGHSATCAKLEAYIKTLGWQGKTLKAIGFNYK